MFSHPNKNVPSAAAFFSVSIFNLSGAINVLLFLIFRPQLLLFTPPEGFSEPALAEPSTSSAILEETVKYNHSPQPTGRELAGDGDWNQPRDTNDVPLSPMDPRPRLEGV
jgi:hypothetical protein